LERDQGELYFEKNFDRTGRTDEGWKGKGLSFRKQADGHDVVFSGLRRAIGRLALSGRSTGQHLQFKLDVTCEPRHIMFSRPLLALLALAGVVASESVQLRVQDPETSVLRPPQTEVTNKSRLDLPFGTRPLGSEFEPVGELKAVGSDQWTILRHPLLPKYSARIKESNFCDTTVK